MNCVCSADAQTGRANCDDVIKVPSSAPKQEARPGCGLSGYQRPRGGEARAEDADQLLSVLCHVCSVIASACERMTVGVEAIHLKADTTAMPTRDCVLTGRELVNCCLNAKLGSIVHCSNCGNECCVNCMYKLWGKMQVGVNVLGPEAVIDHSVNIAAASSEGSDIDSKHSEYYMTTDVDPNKQMGGDSDNSASPLVSSVRLKAGRDLEAGVKGEHPGIKGGNADWLRIIGPSTTREKGEGLFCTLWVVDIQANGTVQLMVDIFDECLRSACSCVFRIKGAVAQLRPCRVFAECMCRGDTDPDWDYILRGACFGFRVIDDDCHSSYSCGNYNSITKEPTGKVMTIRLKDELDNGLLTVMKDSCVCTHALGSVPKGDGDFRAIVDCSSPSGDCVNDHTWSCRNKFCYNSVDMVTGLMQKNDVLATVDISNAYRAVNIHPDSRDRQGLAWDFGDGIIFMRDNRLCMGLSSSPYVFSKISDFVVRCLVREGYSDCVNYLDDFCLIGRDVETCGEAQRRLVAILRRIGFYVSYKKLTPANTVTRFLGIEIDSVELELRLPQDKLEKLHNQLESFIRRRKASKSELEGLGGILAHCCKVVKGGRTFSRRVYDLISSVRRNHHKVRLNEEFRLDLKWWLKFAAVFNGKARIIPPGSASVSVYSDASLVGFGATHGDDWLAGFFRNQEGVDSEWLGHHISDTKDIGWDTDNINVLELWPILEGVRRWSKGWADTSVVFVTDNTQVQAALNTGRSKNKTTMGWLRLIFWESIRHNFDVSSVYINTKDNTICDSLSRLSSFKNIARIRDADVAGKMCCHHIFNC